MTDVEVRYKRICKRVARLQRAADRAEGAYDEKLKALQELGYDSIEDAEQAVQDLLHDAEQAEADLLAALEKFEDEYADEIAAAEAD